MPKRKFLATRNGLLTTTAALGLAAAMVASGVPARVHSAYADAVKVQAPQEPGFADVVEAVSPAVVFRPRKIRHQTRILEWIQFSGTGFGQPA